MKHAPEVAAAIETLRTAGWDVREYRAHGELLPDGDIAPGGVVSLRYGGDGTVYLRTVAAQPWEPQPHDGTARKEVG